MNPSQCFLNIGKTVERAETEVAFSSRTEATARRSHQMRFAEQQVEEVPTAEIVRSLQPNVGSVDSTKDFDAGFLQALSKEPGIVHVEVNQSLHLRFAFRAVRRRRTLLNHIRRTVELCRLTSVPELVNGNFFPGWGLAHQLLRNHSQSTSNAGEADALAETAKLNRAVLRPSISKMLCGIEGSEMNAS